MTAPPADAASLRDHNFVVCFGCQRGGTTWLADQLYKHPDAAFPPRKEIRYLDPLYVHDFDRIQKERVKELRRRLWNSLGEEPAPMVPRLSRELAWNAKYALVSREDYNDAWYASLFSDVEIGKPTGDFSPDYSLLPDEGVAHLARLAPNAKLVFMMRDPVDRTWSGATYPLRHEKQLSPEEQLERVGHWAGSALQKQFSDYKTIIQRFERHFPNDAFLFAFHDDIADNPMGLLEQVCDHIGLTFAESHFQTTDKSINRSPSLPKDDAILRAITTDHHDVLEWLADRFGGHAAKWRARAHERLQAA